MQCMIQYITYTHCICVVVLSPNKEGGIPSSLPHYIGQKKVTDLAQLKSRGYGHLKVCLSQAMTAFFLTILLNKIFE